MTLDIHHRSINVKTRQASIRNQLFHRSVVIRDGNEQRYARIERPIQLIGNKVAWATLRSKNLVTELIITLNLDFRILLNLQIEKRLRTAEAECDADVAAH